MEISNVRDAIRIRKGDQDAQRQLFCLAYADLLRIAERIVLSEPANLTLEPKALVEEAFLRVCAGGIEFQDRAHFYAVAAVAMRRILVDRVRKRRAVDKDG